MNIIANLTAKQKAVIRRDFLIDNFKGAYGNNATATLLLDFARKHMPDTLAEIESGYNEREFEIKSKDSKLSVIDKLYVNGGLLFKKAVCRDSRQGVGYKVTE